MLEIDILYYLNSAFQYIVFHVSISGSLNCEISGILLNLESDAIQSFNYNDRSIAVVSANSLVEV